MYIAQIDFEVSGSITEEAQDQIVYNLLACFLHDGRIGNDYQILESEKSYTAFVTIPAEDAFDNFDSNPYISQIFSKLSEVNLLPPTFKILGNAIDFVADCDCKNSTAFILYTGTFSSSITPLFCYDCFNAIPLYRLPRPGSDGFFNFYIWQKDYKSCDSLQIHCQTGERFGLREMLEIDSSLTQVGLGICEIVEQLTNKYCYYFLYKYRGISKKKELERKCPKCKNAWLLKEKLHRLFDFKCDSCHLLGNIADSLR